LSTHLRLGLHKYVYKHIQYNTHCMNDSCQDFFDGVFTFSDQTGFAQNMLSFG
jgi:hypothetical protein